MTTAPSTPPPVVTDAALFRLLVAKEWRHVLFSPRFAAACAVVAVSVLLAVGLGLQEHRAFRSQQAAARALLAEEQAQAAEWMSLRQRVFREADPLQVFVSGVHRDVGRFAPISSRVEPELTHGIYADEPIFALFRTFDLAFVVTVVLSLFAVVFTYDALCGEREAGTLRLLAAHAVPRTVVVAAKGVGLWLALLVPVVLAAMLGLAVALASGLELEADHWIRLGVFALASVLYLTLFTFLGLASSALTHRPATSFLVLLALWVGVVLVVPRAALVVAVRAAPVPSTAELDAQREGFESRAWDEHLEGTQQRWAERSRAMQGMSSEERQAYEDERTWAWLEEDDRAREETETAIRDNSDRLRESALARREEQRRLALGLSRLSPASAYQLVAVAAAGTGLDLLQRWQDAVGAYRVVFLDWMRSQGAQTGVHAFRRSGGAGGSSGLDAGAPLDIEDMPRFVPPRIRASEALASTPLDLGLLASQALLAFALAFVAFLRYDVR